MESENFMRFVERGGSVNYKPWKEWKEDDFVVGEYVNQKTDKFGKPSYTLRVIDSNIELQEGSSLALNSCGSLNYKMEQVAEGAIVKVVYTGTGVVEKGQMKGKDFHKVDLFVGEGGDEVESDEDML